MSTRTFYNENYQVKFSLKITELGPNARSTGGGLCSVREGEEVIRIEISSRETPGTLIHEITHAADFMFDELGIERNFPTDENYSYLVGWLTDKMLPIFLKHKQ